MATAALERRAKDDRSASIPTWTRRM